ncbi:type IV secretory system conjugative DNA transfer family protein [Phytomonospora endophytica]|uniref:Type IV secretory pathway TraG/TraD family ATPase VirD4 n=1 Tax=Phytomonospora endophytica TaxID=714109 RepID=A0A841G0K3_9ACTN|nr:type IV secretory system conjugative DNA transfer family protein [Phytomonospora endophytica]MBB6037690.1 type IV secretory pathway TraG/TraD family ATPase VirD4 [Phytomonospora endophytica]GIG67783.1 hypothetical protein Pen01_40780 [Phytomonospora endophytica]
MANTVSTRRGVIDSGQDALILGGLLLVAAGSLGTWTTGQLAGFMVYGTWPTASLGDGLHAALHVPAHLDDPRQAWPLAVRDGIPGPVPIYIAAVVVLAVFGVAGFFVLRASGRGRRVRGFATRTELARALSKAACLKNGARLRPSLPAKAVEVDDVAVRLGRALPSNMELFALVDQSVWLEAAPRIGKSSQVIIPWLGHWRGPAVVTSVRPDVIENTYQVRQDRGPVAVMDLNGGAWPHRLSWSPLSGCEEFDKARDRAGVLVTVGKGNDDSKGAGYFGMTATNLLAAWMHAAALQNLTMESVLEWAMDDTNSESVAILKTHPSAALGVGTMLDRIYSSPEEPRSSVWTTVLTGVAPLLSKAAREVFCPATGHGLNIEEFLRDNGTLYLLIPEHRAKDLAPLISAFVDEVTHVAKRLADRNPGGRLDPALGMFLDEIGNVAPLPNLASLMSYAGGSGIFITAVFQSFAQARQRWGRDGADMLWAASTTKIALGGLSGDELEAFSKLTGSYDQTITTTQHGRGGTSTSTSLRERPTMSAKGIRTLSADRREALVIHSTTPAIKTIMRRHYETADAKTYAASVEYVHGLTTATKAWPISDTPVEVAP